jgi:hypothetical protein
MQPMSVRSRYRVRTRASRWAVPALIPLLVVACSKIDHAARTEPERGDAESAGSRPDGPVADVSQELIGGNGQFLGAASGLGAPMNYSFMVPSGYAAHEYVGSAWAFAFNAILGARLGVFYYGRVIDGLALWPGTKHQYPLYDSLAMGVQMMVFTYLLGRTDSLGRTLIEAWADSGSTSRLRSSLRSLAAFVVIGHAVYLSVFAPHFATKLLRLQTVGPTEQFFEGVPNQPL